MDNPLVQPDPGLFIWTILTFLVLVALLSKFAWRPLLEALDAPGWLAPDAIVSVERPARHPVVLPSGWRTGWE